MHPGGASININKAIWDMYLNQLLPLFVYAGDDGNYASTAASDLICLQVKVLLNWNAMDSIEKLCLAIGDLNDPSAKPLLVLTTKTITTSFRPSLEESIMGSLWLRSNSGMLQTTMNLQSAPRYGC